MPLRRVWSDELQFLRGEPDASPNGDSTDEDVEEDDLATDAVEDLV